MDKIEKIRQEIERRIKLYDGNNTQELWIGNTYRAVLSFLDTLSEEPDKSLEEAALGNYYGGGYIPKNQELREVALKTKEVQSFIAGAEWQASQMPMPEDTVLFQKGVAEGKRLMMEEAVEGSVNQDGILELSNGEAIDVCPSLDKCALGLQLGEKVKLIIVKDNDTE